MAAPLAGVQLAQVALTTVDTIVLGTLGVRELAAGGMALLLYNQFRTMCSGLIATVGNRVAAAASRAGIPVGSRLWSASLSVQDYEAIRREVRAGMAAGLAAVLAGLLACAGSALLLLFLSRDGELARDSAQMLLMIAPTLLPMILQDVLRQFSVGLRHTHSLLLVTLGAVVLNAALDMLFCYGWGWGMLGIAAATLIAQIFMAGALYLLITRDRVLRPLLALNPLAARRAHVWGIVREGYPLSLSYGCEAGVTTVMTLLMATCGSVALAASNAVNTIAYIVYQLNIGISHGASILLSSVHARGRYREDSAGSRTQIRRISRYAWGTSAAITGVLAPFYLLFPGSILTPFLGGSPDPGLIEVGAPLLALAIIQQWAKGGQNVTMGLLRGLRDTASTLPITLFGYGMVAIPLMFILARTSSFGPAGIWGGLCIGFMTTAALLLLRFIIVIKR